MKLNIPDDSDEGPGPVRPSWQKKEKIQECYTQNKNYWNEYLNQIQAWTVHASWRTQSMFYTAFQLFSTNLVVSNSSVFV